MMRSWTLTGLLLALGTAQAAPACEPNPLGKRELFLRGTMNNWTASDEHRFFWACKHFELITSIQGEHSFKIADEDWTPGTDFGGTPDKLVVGGSNLSYRFNGSQKLVLTMSKPEPQLSIATCPAPPLGDTTLFLRGTMTSWAPLEEYAFQFRCDAYYLNVSFDNRQEFKIADAGWTPATTFGMGKDGKLSTDASPGGTSNVQHGFGGEHTIRLAFESGQAQLSIGPRSFASRRQPPSIEDPVALSLRFDSRDAGHKSPFGAVVAGSEVRFALDAKPGVTQASLVVEKRQMEGNQERLEYTEVARVPMTKQSLGSTERWSASHRFADKAIYGYYFEVEIGGKRYIYQNNKDSVFWTREKGSMGLGLVELPEEAKRIRRYRQTVHAAHLNVPTWARDAVYYYIFPERFRNGDPTNDPKPGRDRYQDKGIEKHARWLDKPWRPGAGDGSDGVHNNDFFGGDLAGIIDKLDYIRELGANTIYMTPIFRAASNHKYDTADYHHIDPAFGSDADFERLTREAAKRGLRVIVDASLNHVGSDSIYFDRYRNFGAKGAFAGGKVQPASPYAQWFKFDTSQSEPGKQYKGWGGEDLPEIDKSSKSFRSFAYGAPDSVMKVWLDRGAAGWRMDVAPWVPDDFWREWRSTIKSHKPDALLIAETWFDSSKFFLGDSFDSTMNYIFRNTVLDYAAGGAAEKLYANIELMREAYPAPAFYALMNLLSTHDVARSLHHFGYLEDGNQTQLAQAKQRLRLAVLFQMSFPGAPAVYYGDEVGVSGGDDPYNRATYPWADEGGQPDLELLAEFKRLIAMRAKHKVLRHGSIAAPLHLDSHVIVLARQDGKTWAITAMNNAAIPKKVKLKLPAGLHGKQFIDALGGAALRANGAELELTVPALYGTVLVSR